MVGSTRSALFTFLLSTAAVVVLGAAACSGANVVGDDGSGGSDDSAGAFGLPGRNDPSSLCAQVCDCTGCTDEERDDCVDDLVNAESQASDAGCASEYDDYSSCVSSAIDCRDGELDVDGCEGEAVTLTDCGS